MYAIIKDGSHQHRVEEGQVLKVALRKELKAGDTVEFDRVSLLGGEKIAIGAPFVKDASVTAEVLAHGKDKKVIAFKFKRRKSSKRKQGHRQQHTKVRIVSIQGGK